jgi:formyl-CoA transferase
VLGEHTAEVLAEFGFSVDEIAALEGRRSAQLAEAGARS